MNELDIINAATFWSSTHSEKQTGGNHEYDNSNMIPMWKSLISIVCALRSCSRGGSIFSAAPGVPISKNFGGFRWFWKLRLGGEDLRSKWVFRQCPAFCLKGRFLSMEYFSSHTLNGTGHVSYDRCWPDSPLGFCRTRRLVFKAKFGQDETKRNEFVAKVQIKVQSPISKLPLHQTVNYVNYFVLFLVFFFNSERRCRCRCRFFSVGKSTAKVSSTPKRQRLSKPWSNSWPWPIEVGPWGDELASR